ncbi:MAG TPA: peptide chain release factor 2 [Clostridiaceae bacterium]|jgi:peptide chain release factor 2|nr:peptide chain release factor 2 [Clostridiaceae bacterium]
MLEYDRYNQAIAQMKAPIARLGEALDVARMRDQAAELEARAAEPDFWQDIENAQKVQTKMKHLQDRIDRYAAVQSRYEDLLLLLELGSEEDDPEIAEDVGVKLAELEEMVDQMTLETLLTGEHDASNALVTLHAGAGGTEAQDWCEMLYRMYARWAESRGFALSVLDYQDGEEAGIKSVSFKLDGENAYGYMRSEHGVHRLVRISPFDSSGRRHTSFASVEVLPELDSSIQIDIRSEDLKVDTYRSSGAGGQHVNKTSSAVRLTHLPTGIVVACQNERSQIQNRETALDMLKAKLYQLAKQKNLDRIEDLKGDVMDNAWGSQIRSYVFCPYTMVKDHRTNMETGDVDGVMDGAIDPFIEAFLAGA